MPDRPDEIERHYYAATTHEFATATGRATVAAELRYVGHAHAHRYSGGNVPCNRQCRTFHPTTATAADRVATTSGEIL